MKISLVMLFLLGMIGRSHSQVTEPVPEVDTSLRITNMNAVFTQNIDSVYVYQFSINKDPKNYYWQLKNAPVGLTIHKDNGTMNFRAAKNYFQSGRLKYDFPYQVRLGVQSLTDPKDKVDTTFSILFYNTEIIPSRVKPTVSGTVYIDEGERISFRVQCETGSFPIETILVNSNVLLAGASLVNSCDEEFNWTPGFDFVKETDSAKMKQVLLTFIGATRFKVRDTAVLRIFVRDALNYSLAKESFEALYKNIQTYVLQLKFAFLQLDKKIRKIKNTRLAFDLTSASTALTGTILNTSSDADAQKAGKILPSVGLALTPIKEASAPNKPVEQNQAAMIRGAIKRLEYMLQDHQLVGDRDSEILRKTQRLKDELKQVQIQMIDIPIDINMEMSEKELNEYFNSERVTKKYRLKR